MMVTTVPMTAGGPSERMTASVMVEPEGVWLSLQTARGMPSGAPMTAREALSLARQLIVAAVVSATHISQEGQA